MSVQLLLCDAMPDLSDSSLQGIIAERLLDRFEQLRGVCFERNGKGFRTQSILISDVDKVRVEVDGISHDPKILVEVYAGIDGLRGAQPNKIACDILKLVTLKHHSEAWHDATLVILLAAEKGMKVWVKHAAINMWNVEICILEPDESDLAMLREVRQSQALGNRRRTK